MKARHAVIAAGLLLAPSGNVAAEDGDIYIEFLWSKPPAGAIARQQTRQFVTEGNHDHQVCVAANAEPTEVGGLRLEFLDAQGARVSLERHPHYRGAKHCYPANLGKGGVPGDWTVRAVLGDGREQSAQIRVDPRIEDSPQYLERGVPYVAGRPNYDASIPPEAWVGRLVWAMDVDPQGKVTHVEVEVAEGVGERLRDRAIAAGYLTLFPPDPGRVAEPLRWRRTLSFAPE
ncbi:hypothetical protein OK348_13915 [Flavobacterium sp. MXW15]|uniref:TonB C-terminal domain-containing protein n=1 Tax=Xanthomonas chitinilytica TaxID=2989819 RepID=A0ABT3JXR3_9XANT|nr:hypothetical protein [Xanthomonas sp. H13-6]MCW4455882.1 hypothetical protein [Flavobacterium sp. MXW15]MCW4473258.1 hypothetical protein [Xanthomonas sp. H13-6]